MNDGPVLVVGALGGFGRAIAEELLGRGAEVRAFVRDPGLAERTFGARDGLTVHGGDVRDLDALLAAAHGCWAIVNAVNVPYSLWREVLPEATSRIVAAACPERAVILQPGNVYVYGDQTSEPLSEYADQLPCSRKGELRVEVERTLRSAARDGDVRVIVLRGGDFFGPTVRNGLVDPIFGNARLGRAMRLLGNPEAPHQWSYAPDYARLAADLLERSDPRRNFDVVHHAGPVAESQRSFAGRVAELAGQPGLATTIASWWAVKLAGVFNPQAREVGELSYLFDRAVVLDDPRRQELVPEFRNTPLDDAIRATLESYPAEGTPPASWP
jgi:nucleoside-diphosphate-sugar epimerase